MVEYFALELVVAVPVVEHITTARGVYAAPALRRGVHYASMKEIGADPRRILSISAESMMNDGILYFLSSPSQGGVHDKTIDAGELVSSPPQSLCSFLFSVLVLSLCRKEMVVILTVCFSAAVIADTSGILSLIPLAMGLRLFSNNFLWDLSTRPAAL